MRTVGELKKFLADLPDDMVIGGYDGSDHPDYTRVSFYVHDRTEEEEWEMQKVQPDVLEWWAGKVPDKILVCSTD